MIDLILNSVHIFFSVYGVPLQKVLLYAAWVMRAFLYVYCAVGILCFAVFALCVLLDHCKFRTDLKLQNRTGKNSIFLGLILSLAAAIFWIFFLPPVFMKMRRMIR